MSEKKVSYKSASTYYFIGNIFNRGMSFLTVPIFTRILSTYDYGIVTTYNSYVTILTMVLGFALHSGIRIAYVDYKEKYDDFTSTQVFFTLVVSGTASGLIVAGAKLLNIDVSITLLVLCLAHSLSAAIVQDYSYYLMMKYRYKFRTAFMILPNLISVILSVLAVLFICETDLYMGRIIPTAIVNIGFGLIVIVLIFKKSRVLLNKEYLKYGLAYSVPLIIHGIALNILSQSDRVMITSLADASQTGIYSLIYNFSMISTVITTSLEGVWIPWFLQKMKERQIKMIGEMAENYINLMTYAMVCLILVAPEVVKLLASEPYWEGISIIPPIVLANYIIFMYTLYVNVEHYYKKTPYITFNTIIAAVTNLVLNFIFIPKYGYVAAAYTTIVSYFLSFVLHARYAKKLEPDMYPLKTFLRPIAHIAITCVLFYVLINFWYARWMLAIVYFFAMLYKERNRIFGFFPEIKNNLPKRKDKNRL